MNSLLAPPSSGDKSFGDCSEKSKSRDLVSCFNASNGEILSLETHEPSETHVCQSRSRMAVKAAAVQQVPCLFFLETSLDHLCVVDHQLKLD
jgi:hypothetical protein